MRGMRNRMGQSYSGINPTMVLDIVQSDRPPVAEVAQRLGISRQALSASPRPRGPRAEMNLRLVEALDTAPA